MVYISKLMLFDFDPQGPSSSSSPSFYYLGRIFSGRLKPPIEAHFLQPEVYSEDGFPQELSKTDGITQIRIPLPSQQENTINMFHIDGSLAQMSTQVEECGPGNIVLIQYRTVGHKQGIRFLPHTLYCLGNDAPSTTLSSILPFANPPLVLGLDYIPHLFLFSALTNLILFSLSKHSPL